MLLDGSEGHKMLDNITVDRRGHVLATEDVGGNDHIGRVYRYDIATDALTVIAPHDSALFTPVQPASSRGTKKLRAWWMPRTCSAKAGS